MPRRLKVWFLVCLCALHPAAARADDGGWIEWLEKMSGPKMVGFATDVHLFCIDPEGRRFDCERWFGLKPQTFEYRQIRHELDARVGFYWKRGDERFSDVTGDTRRINALKLGVMYRYHPNTIVSMGTGVGFMPFFGDGFDTFTRPIWTPVSVIVTPFRGHRIARAFYVRLEDSYLGNSVNGASFGNPNTSFSTGGEWNTSYGIGFDFRRR